MSIPIPIGISVDYSHGSRKFLMLILPSMDLLMDPHMTDLHLGFHKGNDSHSRNGHGNFSGIPMPMLNFSIVYELLSIYFPAENHWTHMGIHTYAVNAHMELPKFAESSYRRSIIWRSITGKICFPIPNEYGMEPYPFFRQT